MTTVESDLKRMVQNAKDYNAPKSDIYEDAERIRKLAYNYMKDNNPQYREDPDYISFATPIPQANGAVTANGTRVGEATQSARASREVSERPKQTIILKASEAPSDRKASLAPSGATGDEEDADADADEAGGDLDFTSLSFQEAQQKMISHLLHYTNSEYVCRSISLRTRSLTY